MRRDARRNISPLRWWSHSTGKARRVAARGRDIYAFTAPLVCTVAELLLTGRFREPGAQPPGAILDAAAVLASLAPDHLELDMKSG